MPTFAVLVTLRWGDQIIRIERWTGGPTPLGLDLRIDACKRPCLSGARLETGAPLEVGLAEGLAPYRSDHRRALVAQVELMALPRHAAKWRPIGAALGAVALQVVLGLSTFAQPKLAKDDDASIDREFKVDLPVRADIAVVEECEDGIHVVAENETLTSIAAMYGMKDYRAIYNEVVNKALVALRPDPNRVLPGDLVNIPSEGLGTSF